jgi:hypothetical protein
VRRSADDLLDDYRAMSKEDEVPGVDESHVGTPDVTIQSEWQQYEYPSTAVVEAVAAATNRDPLTLTPLYEYVDADGLDALLTATTSDAGAPVDVSFTYESARVTISSDGSLEVRADAEAVD